MTASELRATFALASIMAMRMLGLFMVLPVFAIYATQLEGVTPTLAGIAMGIYGLTQTCLQIPFGMLSDRFGRKPIISLGLAIFAIGSVIAALSHNIIGIIIGRALQGSGAVSSALLALTADLTREEQRTKAMAIMGISIGMSFIVALIIGPVLSNWIGVLGIFWVSAVLALLAIVLLYKVVPQPMYTVMPNLYLHNLNVSYKTLNYYV
jgi:MFS family permease